MRLSMMMLAIAAPALMAFAPAGTGAGAGTGAVDIKAEEAKLMEVSRRWSALAAEGKDPAAIANYWADDAVFMQDNLPTMRGRAAIRGMIEGAFSMPGFHISWEPIEAHVAALGDMGYIIERSVVTEPGASGKPVTHRMRALTVWRKDAKGEWRNVVDMSNAEIAAEPPSAATRAKPR